MRNTQVVFLTSCLLASCVGPGLLTDGSSVSVGHHSRGALRHGISMPLRGEGFIIPQIWRERKRTYATDEMVQLLVRTARRVRRSHGRSSFGIADLSEKSGGPALPEHGSHHSGRDVDLIFHALNLSGRPIVPKLMIAYNAKGMAIPPKVKEPDAGPPREGEGFPPPFVPRRLDVARTWGLVKAIATDPYVPVQWIFIGRPIIRLLLAHARKIREPQYLIERIARVMHQPGDASPHIDHMHVRIYCSLADRYQGCQDRGPGRWFKKTLKYTRLSYARPGALASDKLLKLPFPIGSLL
jgi:murein endopeptidase